MTIIAIYKILRKHYHGITIWHNHHISVRADRVKKSSTLRNVSLGVYSNSSNNNQDNNGYAASLSPRPARDETQTQNKYSLNVKSSPTSGSHSGICQNRCKINEHWRTEGKQIPYLAWHYLLTLRMIISINRLSKPQVGCGKNKGFDCHPFQMLTRRCWCTCHSGANNVITRIMIRAFNCAEAMSNRALGLLTVAETS